MKKHLVTISIVLLINTLFAQDKSNSLNQGVNNIPQYGFIENKGQIYDQNYKANSEVLYLLSLNNGLNIQLKSNGFSYDTYETEIKENKSTVDINKKRTGDDPKPDVTRNFHRVDIELLGANNNPQIIAEDPSIGYLNYYNSVTQESGATYVSNYKKITYKNIYPDIDMVFEAHGSIDKPIEYSFVVHPGGNAEQIKLHYNGAIQTQLIKGKINIRLIHGSLTESIPASWIKETQKEINISYKSCDQDIFSFNIPNYPKTETLIIDPNPDLDWGTYFGNDGEGAGQDISNCVNGSVFIIGLTNCVSNIATTGAYQTTLGGYYDAFVTKIDTSGVLQWSTYYGGNGDDYGYGITCDDNENIIITGYTKSNSGIATAGAHQETNPYSNLEAFIAKFDKNGLRKWGTYYGGSNNDEGQGITADRAGNIYVVGRTQSTNNIATTAAHDTTFGGDYDVFIVKFDSSGIRQWGTYYGGTLYDASYGIACDSIGNVFIVGNTRSTTGIATSIAHQNHLGEISGTDGFISKFNPNGELQWGTYYGGQSDDPVWSVACDKNGNVFVTGYGSSSSIASAGAYQTSTMNGSTDAYIAKFNNNGVRQWGTFYGGNDYDGGSKLVCDEIGNVYVTGTASSSSGIATNGAYQTIYGGNNDAFIVKFSPSGARLSGTYFGGSLGDYGGGISYIGNGRVILTGSTKSTAGISTTGAYQTVYDGGTGWGSCYIAKFSLSDIPSNVGIITGHTTVCNGQDSVTYSVSGNEQATSYVWTLPSGEIDTTYTNQITIDFGESSVSGNISVYGRNSCGNGSPSLMFITVKPAVVNTGIISGLTDVCQNQTNVVYTVSSVDNATSYIWTMPSGQTDTTTTNSITVNYSPLAISGNIAVKGANSCSQGPSSSLSISVSPLPVESGTITGEIIVCQGQNSVIYSVPSIANATSYIWTLPNGATGTSTTNSIAVDYGTSAVSGNITVKGHNDCGDGIPSILTISVNPIPNATGATSGTTAVCQGQNDVIYMVPTVANATSYIWTLPNGATGTSTTNSIAVDYGTSAVSGNITVKGHNDCGDGAISILPITVTQTPATPIISNIGNNVLRSSSIIGNQWYNQNGIIIGATNQDLYVIESGDYYVVASINECSSSPSNTINVTDVAVPDSDSDNTMRLYPNPFSNEFTIEINKIDDLVNFEIINAMGQVIHKSKFAIKTTIETGQFATGVYLIKIQSKNTVIFKKIVKE